MAQGRLWPISGPTNFKAERPVHDNLAAVGAALISGTAAVDDGRQPIQTNDAQPNHCRSDFAPRLTAICIVLRDGRNFGETAHIVFEFRRRCINQFTWNVIQFPGTQPPQDNEGLEVGNGQAMVRKKFSTVAFKLMLEPLQILGQCAGRQGIASIFQIVAFQPKACSNLDIDVLQC